VNALKFSLPEPLAGAVKANVNDWQSGGKMQRRWNRDATLWTGSDVAITLPVPGQKYTFGVVKAAQARGDFQVLAERSRRALRVHGGAI